MGVAHPSVILLSRQGVGIASFLSLGERLDALRKAEL